MAAFWLCLLNPVEGQCLKSSKYYCRSYMHAHSNHIRFCLFTIAICCLFWSVLAPSFFFVCDVFSPLCLDVQVQKIAYSTSGQCISIFFFLLLLLCNTTYHIVPGTKYLKIQKNNSAFNSKKKNKQTMETINHINKRYRNSIFTFKNPVAL